MNDSISVELCSGCVFSHSWSDQFYATVKFMYGEIFSKYLQSAFKKCNEKIPKTQYTKL